jgi:hypothetical protein
MKLYVAVDECLVKGDADQPDSHFNCVVVEAYIYGRSEIATSGFTPAECKFHDIVSDMINDKLGYEGCEGYWSHALKQLGRKLDKHGYCPEYGEVGAVLFVDASLITRCELQRIVDNAIRVTEVANEEQCYNQL